jgi:hypothetical protein
MKFSVVPEKVGRFVSQVIVKTWRAYANYGGGHMILFAAFAVKMLILPLRTQKP